MADQQIDMLCQGKTSRETAKCKKQLDFKKGYEAVEIVQGRQTVYPTGNKTGIGGGTSKTQVDAKPSGTTVDASTKKVAVEVRPQKKIFIDPANRKVGEIKFN